MRRSLWVFLLSVVLLTACSESLIVGSGACPKWATFSKCKIGIWNVSFRSAIQVDFSQWSKLRFTVINEDVVVDKAINIEFKTEEGNVIVVENTRLLPGTYYVDRVVESEPASFVLISSTGRVVTIGGEFVLLE